MTKWINSKMCKIPTMLEKPRKIKIFPLALIKEIMYFLGDMHRNDRSHGLFPCLCGKERLVHVTALVGEIFGYSTDDAMLRILRRLKRWVEYNDPTENLGFKMRYTITSLVAATVLFIPTVKGAQPLYAQCGVRLLFDRVPGLVHVPHW